MFDDDDMQTRLARARVGRVLREKWRLDALLGVGGMAAVYAATHRNGKRVAVKVLHAVYSQLDEVRRRFLAEGYVANAVGHEGAVSILDDDVGEDGSVFLVLELLEGETLEARWERSARRLSVDEVLALAIPLLDVLAAAHAKDIVHRDVKPENIFLTQSGVLKVLDFGIAQMRAISGKSRITRGDNAIGTPQFMAPEQARGRPEEVDARTDLWAVGATMFTLLAGRCVHDGGTVNEVLCAAMTREAPPLHSIAAWVPEATARVINRALAFEKTARWPDARAMQAAVRDARRPSVVPPAEPEVGLETCVDCRAKSPPSGPDALPSSFGWRLLVQRNPQGMLVPEWRCPPCWEKHKMTVGAPSSARVKAWG